MNYFKRIFLPALVVLTAVVCFALLFNRALSDNPAKKSVRKYLKESPEGKTYEPQAWGYAQVDDPYAGSGTTKPFWGESKALSRYSIVHRFRMRNGFGMLPSFDMRFFFSDDTYSNIIGYEYMRPNDPTEME